MIHGIGTDIVSITRCEALLERQGRRIAERILTPEELCRFDSNPKPAAFLAKRFAAKEATAKALGTGFSGGLSLQHIEVTNNTQGAPLLRFHARAAELHESFQIINSHLSLSDDDNYAVAFVTLERSP